MVTGIALLAACEPASTCTGTVTRLPIATAASGVTAVAEPARTETVVDPLHDSCITRLTDHDAAGIDNFIRNDYSRRQAFNANDTRLVAYVSGGTWRQLDAATGRDLGRLPGLVGDAEPQWHPTKPDLLFYIPDFGGLTVHQLNVRTGVTTTIGDFTGRLPWPNAARVHTGSEGSPSANSRWWGFMVETQNGSPLGLMVWDRYTDTIRSTLSLEAQGLDGPNYVTMSPTGDFLIGGWDDATGVRAYKRSLNRNQWVQLAAQGEHSDIALLPNGNDAYVALDFEAAGGPVQYTDIREAINTGTAAPVTLFDTYLGSGSYTSIHFSGKAFDRPGWVLASTYGGGGPHRWYKHRLLAIELTPGGRVLGLAHHHGEVDTYFEEIHASVNRDFSQLVFNSNWGTNDGVDIYLLDDLAWIPDAGS